MTEDDAIAGIKPRLTPEFLATLTEAARIVGWSVDHLVTCGFVVHTFRMAGVTPPSLNDLEPREFEEPT